MHCIITFLNIVLLFVLFLCMALCHGVQTNKQMLQMENSEYDDPYSFYQMPQEQVNSNEVVLSNENFVQSSCKDVSYELFSRRLINILVSKSNFQVDKDGILVGNLVLNATKEQFDIIKRFGEGKICFKEIDDIINNIIQPVEISTFDKVLSFTEILSIQIYQHRFIIGLSILTIFIILVALKVNWTRWMIRILIFDIMCIISFMITWQELLQEAEIKLLAQQKTYSNVSEECTQEYLGISRSILIFFGFGKRDCFKHLEAVMSDPALKVTPLHALSHMGSKFFLHPLSLVGQYLSNFIENITASLPFPFGHIARFFLIILVLLLITTIIISYSGGGWGIRLGPLFHFYLHGRMEPQNPLAATDHQRIEIIRSEIKEALSAPSTTSIESSTLLNTENSIPICKNKTSSRKAISNEKCIVSKNVKSSISDNKIYFDSEKNESDKSSDFQSQEEVSDTSSSHSDDYAELRDFEKVSKKL